MSARRKTIENSIKRLKESMLNYMLVANEAKVEAGLFSVSVGKSKSVYVADEKKIPQAYLVPQPPKIDKTAISKALKAGEEVDGAFFMENPYLTIR